jgi:hypothetical protein
LALACRNKQASGFAPVVNLSPDRVTKAGLRPVAAGFD